MTLKTSLLLNQKSYYWGKYQREETNSNTLNWLCIWSKLDNFLIFTFLFVLQNCIAIVFAEKFHIRMTQKLRSIQDIVDKNGQKKNYLSFKDDFSDITL